MKYYLRCGAFVATSLVGSLLGKGYPLWIFFVVGGVLSACIFFGWENDS